MGKAKVSFFSILILIMLLLNSKYNKKKKRTVVFRYTSTCFELEMNDPSEYHDSWHCSTKGVGATAPDPKASQILEDGVIVPLGNPKNQRKQVRSTPVYVIIFTSSKRYMHHKFVIVKLWMIHISTFCVEMNFLYTKQCLKYFCRVVYCIMNS